MTDSLAAKPSPTDARTPARRRLAFIVGSLVLALGSGGWVLTASHARGQIEIVMGVPKCTGTDVRWVNFEGQAAPQMTLNEGMDCFVTITIRNPGGLGVAIDELSWPILGPAGMPGVEALYLDAGQYLPRADEIDAVFPVDYSLDAHSSVDFQLRLAFRPGGCTPEGTLWIPDTPALALSAMGLSGEISGDAILMFHGTRASSCDTEVGE